LQKTKPATAPGYDNIHVEFMKNLGPRARTWLSKFFSRIMATHSISKIWRKAKVIAIEKPGKDPSLPANYRPVSLLSVCYKLLERLALQRITSCTPAHYSHSRRFTQSKPGSTSDRQTVTSYGAGCSLAWTVIRLLLQAFVVGLGHF